jgi:hypothetical protein
MVMTWRDLTKHDDIELQEEVTAVATHDPMLTRRNLTKDNDNNELHKEEEVESAGEQASHDLMPTDGATTRAHILRVIRSGRSPTDTIIAKQIVTLKRQPASHTTIWKRR